jgi:hypothetical protein
MAPKLTFFTACQGSVNTTFELFIPAPFEPIIKVKEQLALKNHFREHFFNVFTTFQ